MANEHTLDMRVGADGTVSWEAKAVPSSGRGASTVATMANLFQRINAGPLDTATSNPNFDREAWARATGSATLYLIGDQNNTAMTSSLLVPALLRLLREADAYAEENSGALPYRLQLLLDEMPNLAPIPGVAEKLATARSKRVQYLICTQTLSQLQLYAGELGARAILGNAEVVIALSGITDTAAVQELMSLAGAGRATSVSTTEAEGKELRKSTPESEQVRQFIDGGHFLRMLQPTASRDGDGIVIFRGGIAKLRMRLWSRDLELVHRGTPPRLPHWRAAYDATLAPRNRNAARRTESLKEQARQEAAYARANALQESPQVPRGFPAAPPVAPAPQVPQPDPTPASIAAVSVAAATVPAATVATPVKPRRIRAKRTDTPHPGQLNLNDYLANFQPPAASPAAEAEEEADPRDLFPSLKKARAAAADGKRKRVAPTPEPTVQAPPAQRPAPAPLVGLWGRRHQLMAEAGRAGDATPYRVMRNQEYVIDNNGAEWRVRWDGIFERTNLSTGEFEELDLQHLMGSQAA